MHVDAKTCRLWRGTPTASKRTRRPLIVITMAISGMLCACGPQNVSSSREKSAVAKERPRSVIFPALPKRSIPKSHQISEHSYGLLKELGELVKEISAAETQLNDLQHLEKKHDIDRLLALDVSTQDAHSLATIYHFCDKGYFTAHREALTLLMRRYLARAERQLAAEDLIERKPVLTERLEDAIFDSTEKLRDLQEVLLLYADRQQGEIMVPPIMKEKELKAMRTLVGNRLILEKEKAEALDHELATLTLRFDEIEQILELHPGRNVDLR